MLTFPHCAFTQTSSTIDKAKKDGQERCRLTGGMNGGVD